MSCDSWDSNAPFDVLSFPDPDDHMNPVALYLGDHMERYLTHPYASPLFGDFRGLPPLLIQVGDAEVLRDEVTLLAHKATLQGVEVRHELYEDAVCAISLVSFLVWSRWHSTQNLNLSDSRVSSVSLPRSFGAFILVLS
jgi:acetyl esterase/lipase